MTERAPLAAEPLRIATPAGEVSALLLRPAEPRHAYVFAHGAGAGMAHAFMGELATLLAARGVATLRFQFPYMEARKPRTDPPAVATATIQAACLEAARRLPGIPLFAGGKSFGGRMTSTAASLGLLAGVRGLIFVGFPLHNPKQPAITRGEHLGAVPQPMLFLQGTRDDLADLTLVRQVTDRLGARTTLHVVDGANHSFDVLRSAGRSKAEVMAGLADTMATWMDARAHP